MRKLLILFSILLTLGACSGHKDNGNKIQFFDLSTFINLATNFPNGAFVVGKSTQGFQLTSSLTAESDAIFPNGEWTFYIVGFDASNFPSCGMTGNVLLEGNEIEVAVSVSRATCTGDIWAGILTDIKNYGHNFATSEFISVWRTTSASENITLPLRTGYAYDFYVDWGDGSTPSQVTYATDTNRTHMYAAAGDYTVVITGLVEAWYFNNTGDNLKIINVYSLGDVGWRDLSYAFYGCSNLVSLSGGNTSAVTNMSYMFKGTTSLVNLDLAGFNTSSVTNMSYMFAAASALTMVDFTSFNTSSVGDMRSMFEGASALTAMDLSSFNTSFVTSMASMFSNVVSLVNLDISKFNTVAVTDMGYMFYNASSLPNINISPLFTTASVTTMAYMFYGTTALVNLDLSSFTTTNVTTMYSMFEGALALTAIDLSSFATSSVTNMGRMFSGAVSLTTLNLITFTTLAVTNMDYMFSGASGLTDLYLNSWDVVASPPTSTMVFDSMSGSIYCDTATIFGRTCL